VIKKPDLKLYENWIDTIFICSNERENKLKVGILYEWCSCIRMNLKKSFKNSLKLDLIKKEITF